MSKKVIVLGARGFIGSNIAAHLSRNPNSKITALGSKDCNLLDAKAVAKLFETADQDTHIVMASSVLHLPGEPAQIFDENVLMVRNVVDALSEKRIANFIYLSSTDVYGRPPLVANIKEDSPLNLTGYYGLSKFTAEQVLRLGLNTRGPRRPVSMLRLPGIYGPNDQARSIIGMFTKKIATGDKLELVAGGKQLRDYVHAKDVAKICEELIENPFNGPLNIATGRALPLHEVISKIATELGKEPVIVHKEATSPQYDLTFNNALLCARMPRLKFISVEEGIKEYVQANR